MDLYETIFTRRQVRKFNETPLPSGILKDITHCVSETDQLGSQKAEFKVVSPESVSSNTSAPHYLLAYCDQESSAYANVGYVMQKADLFIQSIGFGSGWFMGIEPKQNKEGFCIALAFGNTDVPARMGSDDFKRLPIHDISSTDNTIARAVHLAPSSLNSQPWKLKFDNGKVLVKEEGRGLKRIILRNKLNKIDVGIAARHVVVALEHEGKEVIEVNPLVTDKTFEIEIKTL